MPLDAILLSNCRLVHSSLHIQKMRSLKYPLLTILLGSLNKKFRIFDPLPNLYLKATPRGLRSDLPAQGPVLGLRRRRASFGRESVDRTHIQRLSDVGRNAASNAAMTVEVWVKFTILSMVLMSHSEGGFRISNACNDDWRISASWMLTLDLTHYFHYKVLDQNHAFVPSKVARLCSCNGICSNWPVHNSLAREPSCGSKNAWPLVSKHCFAWWHLKY